MALVYYEEASNLDIKTNAFKPALWRQADLYQFLAILVYKQSFRPAKTIHKEKNTKPLK